MEKRWLYLFAGILAGYGVLAAVFGGDASIAGALIAIAGSLIAIASSVGKPARNTACKEQKPNEPPK